jgi:glucose-6-phosphate isomerase
MINANINHIKFENFKTNKKKNNKVNLILKKILRQNTEIIQSLKENYKDKYNKKFIKKFNKFKKINIFGMGGSILGSKALYNFLSLSKKNFSFIDNFPKNSFKRFSKKDLNVIISKSGNTLETIANSNALIKDWKQIIFISENKRNYLTSLADKLKSEIIHHNNYIGGRFSVLSEVGMLPADLMGHNPKKFRRLNQLIKNKNFYNSLINNVSCMYNFYLKGKTNSIILNYDTSANDLFLWYQQLTAESLGKNNKGILPIISSMPSDNHSLMQYYLDGPKNHFFTFFFTKEKSIKIGKKLKHKTSHNISGKTLNQISYAQFLATKKVFTEKNIPFRSFEISRKKEETIGSLFIYFILETILLGNLMKVNPFDQPSVELIKVETKKFL